MNYLLPAVLVVWGALTFIGPSTIYWSKYGFEVNYGIYKWSLGPLAILIGAYWLIHNISKSKAKNIRHSVCPQCKQVYRNENQKLNECPNCDVKLVTLEELIHHNK